MADILETKDKQLASSIHRILSEGKPGVDEKKCIYIKLTMDVFLCGIRIRISDPRSPASCSIKVGNESMTRANSSVLLMCHDLPE